jgi:DNA-binding transcriptional LysR family regulator
MQGYVDLFHGTLTIGTTRSFAKYLMPGLVSRFQERYTSIKVKLGEGSSQEVADAVISYKYDLGVIGNLPLQSKLKIIPYSKEEFCLVSSPQHRFKYMDSVPLKELEKESIIIREGGSGSRHMVLMFLKSRGINPSVFIETGSVEFIKEYIKKDKGISFLYRPEVEVESKAGLLQIHQIRDDPIILHTDIILPSDVEPSPAVKAFLNIIRDKRPKNE